MSYLLDTNVVSELLRAKPNRTVLAWFRAMPNEALHLSVLSLGEIRKGVERLPDGPRKEHLRLWLEQDLPGWFGDRFLAVSQGVADRWGRMLGQSTRRPGGAIDSLIAATALHHGLRIVTRNESDFRFEGLDVINPWRPRP